VPRQILNQHTAVLVQHRQDRAPAFFVK